MRQHPHVNLSNPCSSSFMAQMPYVWLSVGLWSVIPKDLRHVVTYLDRGSFWEIIILMNTTTNSRPSATKGRRSRSKPTTRSSSRNSCGTRREDAQQYIDLRVHGLAAPLPHGQDAPLIYSARASKSPHHNKHAGDCHKLHKRSPSKQTGPDILELFMYL